MKEKKILVFSAQDPAQEGQLTRSLIYSYINENVKVFTFIFRSSNSKKNFKSNANYHYPIINFSKFKYRYILYNLLHLPRISYEIVKTILLDQSLRIVILGPASLYAIIIIFLSFLKRKTYLITWDIFPYHNIQEKKFIGNSLSLKISKNLEFILYKLVYRIGYMTPNCKKYFRYIYKIPNKKLNYIPIWRISNFDLVSSSKPSIYKSIVYCGQFSPTRNFLNILNFLNNLNIKVDFYLTNFNKVNPLEIKNLEQKFSNLTINPPLETNSVVPNLERYGIGLIALDDKLRFPSFPSKTMIYLESGLPILFYGPENNETCNLLGKPSYIHTTNLSNQLQINNAKNFISKYTNIRKDKSNRLKLKHKIEKLLIRFEPINITREFLNF